MTLCKRFLRVTLLDVCPTLLDVCHGEAGLGGGAAVEGRRGGQNGVVCCPGLCFGGGLG